MIKMLFVVEEAGPMLYRINLHCFPTLLEKFWFKESFEIMIDFILGSLNTAHRGPLLAGTRQQTVYLNLI